MQFDAFECLALKIDNGIVVHVDVCTTDANGVSQLWNRSAFQCTPYTYYRSLSLSFSSKYNTPGRMPGNRSIESEICWTFFFFCSIVLNRILADMSKIYYERSLFGIVFTLSGIYAATANVSKITLTSHLNMRLKIFYRCHSNCIFVSTNCIMVLPKQTKNVSTI